LQVVGNPCVSRPREKPLDLFGSYSFESGAESLVGKMLGTEKPGPELLFFDDARRSQPSSQPKQNGQCEEGKLPRTGPQKSFQRRGAKLEDALTALSRQAGWCEFASALGGAGNRGLPALGRLLTAIGASLCV
jgi:hypothetical protein